MHSNLEPEVAALFRVAGSARGLAHSLRLRGRLEGMAMAPAIELLHGRSLSKQLADYHARVRLQPGERAMMHASITIFTVKDVMASLAYFRDKLGFDVAF